MITVNIEKAKNIAHDMRRAAREKEFAPLDDKIIKRLPGESFEAVDAQRQLIRDKYATIQTKIDAASTPEEIKQALRNE